MSRRRRLTTAGLAAAVVVGAASAVKVAAGRQRRHPDPGADHDLTVLHDREHEIATFDDGTMYVVESGPADGLPVVLCHGVTLSIRTWIYQLAALPEHGFRVIAFDSRGHGKSVCGTAGHSLAHLGADLRTLLETLDLKDAVLVGHSMGGVAVQSFATAFPDVAHERVAGLVLLSTLTRSPFRRSRPLSPAVIRASGVGDRAFASLMARPDAGYLLARIGLGRNAAPSMVELTREMVRTCPPNTRLLASTALTELDLRTAIESIDLPVLVVCGTADLITPPGESRRIARHIPHAEIEWVAGGGHMLMLERPDLVNDLIAGFTKRVHSAATASA